MSGSVLFDAPGRRARARNRVFNAVTALVIALVIWVVYSRLNAKGQLTAAKWEPFLTSNLWTTYVLPGVEGTLTAAAVSIVLALVLGFVLGVGRLSRTAPIRWVCSVIVEFFRAVPVLIMMIFAYFLYALYDVFPSRQLALAGVITGLTLYNGAVIAEIVRAGVYALPRGQSEAAYALGLTWGQTMRSILLPQAVTSMLPVLISQLVVALKDTAIGYVITFLEMVRQGVQLGAAYGNLLPALDRHRDPDDQRQLRTVVVRDLAGRPAAPLASCPDTAGGRGHRAGRRARRPGGHGGARLDSHVIASASAICPSKPSDVVAAGAGLAQRTPAGAGPHDGGQVIAGLRSHPSARAVQVSLDGAHGRAKAACDFPVGQARRN